MSQNRRRLSDSSYTVDGQYDDFNEHIFKATRERRAEYGVPGDYEAGANTSGFLKVRERM